MEKMRILYTLRNYAGMLKNNPRVTDTTVHREISPYRSLNSTTKLLKSARKSKKILGPFLYCNSGFSFEIRKITENPLEVMKEFETDPNSNVTHAIALSGNYSLLIFRKGGDDLVFSDSPVPSFPAKLNVKKFQIDEIEGKLVRDKCPKNWNEMDWRVYYQMRVPTDSYGKIAGRLDVEWITVKRHFEKILKDCKILTSFFPKGYDGYSRLLAVFKTKYELGLLKSLERLNRSSYIWKCNDFLILTLFVENYNATSERLEELEENGMIRNLSISIPIRYYESSISLG